MENNVNLGQRFSRTFDSVAGFVLGGLFIAGSLVYLLVRDTWVKIKAGWQYLVDLGNPDSALNKPKAKVYHLDVVAPQLPVSPSPKKTRKKKVSPVEKSEEVTKRIKFTPSKVALTIPPPSVDEDVNVPARFKDVQAKKKKPGRPPGKTSKKSKTV